MVEASEAERHPLDPIEEVVDTKLRLITRIAYGFRSTDNVIGLCVSTATAMPTTTRTPGHRITRGSSKRA